MKVSSIIAVLAGGLLAQAKFKWLGVNESGAEWGDVNADPNSVQWPNTNTIGTLIGEGYNVFRIPFMMEHMTLNHDMTQINQQYLSKLQQTVQYITSNGATAIVDAHNYGRYYGNIITDYPTFQAFWHNLAGNFKTNPKVIFDTNNEYYKMDEKIVYYLNKAAINGIRASGATSQYIMVEGNHWSSAIGWYDNNNGLKQLSDPSMKLIYQMHQYLDSNGSGQGQDCASATIGVDRIASATRWLRKNKKVGFLGEFSAGTNDQCKQAVTNLLNFMQDNSDVWWGATIWAAGPGWGGYPFSFEPPSGTAYQYYDSLLRTYTP